MTRPDLSCVKTVTYLTTFTA
ncbi:hypothetical protein E2C01_086002 [Portunus trituberculatus]|uniref:Uncharacterized protein n=1 Tax=Portunus trituberculatus TaxID=210409 RepID=A0A5B7JF63_PORTR|nr:hypothetical protein [Portunus trituberculatus]